MKLPNEISTLKEMKDWFEKNNPEVIGVGPKAKMLRIWEMSATTLEDTPNSFRWSAYHGVPIIYLDK